MVKKLLYLLTAFLLAGVALGETNAAFAARFNLTSAEVAQRVQELDRINATGGVPALVGGVFVSSTIRPLRCSQVNTVVRTPNTFYNPIPFRKRCLGFCPRGQICTALKTVTRKVRVVCFRRFNCYGRILWIPIGVRELCITDEFNCECKPRCKPIYCFPPRRFNSRICDCECPPIRCRRPFEQDPASCKCRCPKNIVCSPPKILNFKTCKCECREKCPPNFFQDPNTCRCICRKTCPPPAYIDRQKCECVGDCQRFTTASDCNRIDSCKDNRARRCRYFPSYPTHPCQCDCCIPKNPASSFNCGFYTPFGQFACQFYIDLKTKASPCKWACT